MRVAAGAVAAASLLVLVGCAAVGLPSRPSGEDLSLVAAHPPAGTCVVTRADGRPGRPALASSLAATGLFDSVVAAADASIPAECDWVVEEVRLPYVDPFNRTCPHSAQAVTMLTLGIVPTVISRDGAWSLVLRRAGTQQPSTRHFRVGESVTSVGGWIALPMLLFPWWWRFPTDDWCTGREAELLAVAIVKSGILDEPPPAR